MTSLFQFRCGWLLPLLTAGALDAAVVIRGTVVDNDSGHPIARASVALQVAGKENAKATAIRANSYGAFEFPPMPAGSYRISASRLAFAPVQYGQKRWRSAGMQVTLADNDTASLTIRLPRFGAITGTLLDENDVGLPDHDVVVYTNTRPPRLLARARTDDRGVYRFFGLEPGRYLVRSLAKVYDDGSYLPTFFRDAMKAEQSRPVEVTLDQQVERVDIRPMLGRLYTVSGRVSGLMGAPPAVSLYSDTGSETASQDSDRNFTFNPTAPGEYELLVQSAADHGRPPLAAFRSFTLERDTDVSVPLAPLPTIQFVIEDVAGAPVDARQFKVMARRKDLAGEAPPETLQLGSGKLTLLPGRWDLALVPSTSYCVVGFIPPPPAVAGKGRADGWNEVLLEQASENVVKFVLSRSPATISGVVKNASGDPIGNIPVFLEPFDLEPRKRLTEHRIIQTDSHGAYSVTGLAPGAYRLMSTFEYRAFDDPEFELAQPPAVTIAEGAKLTLDLQEFVIH